MAAAMGLLAVAVLISWSPYPFEMGSLQYLRQSSLQDYLRTLALNRGIPWFQTAGFEELCDTLSGYSNSTLVVSAVVNGDPCFPRPAGVEFYANLTVNTASSSVNLQAWQVAGP